MNLRIMHKTLKDKGIIWFWSDSGKYKDNEIWDDEIFDYKNVFDIDMKVEKGDMLDYQISAMDHAWL